MKSFFLNLFQLKLHVLALLVFSISACGGGGGGGNATPPGSSTVATSSGVGGTISPEGEVVTNGTVLVFTITPETNYLIDTVTGCSGTLEGNTFTTGEITGNCTVSASFKLKTFTVSALAGEFATITPASTQTINYGDTASFTFVPNTGYIVNSVTGCEGTLDGNTYTTGVITADCTVNASISAWVPEPDGLSISGQIKEQKEFDDESVNLDQVRITAMGKTAYSNSEGLYTLVLDTPVDGILIVTYEKDGFATYQRRLDIGDKRKIALDGRLLRYQFNRSKNFSQTQTLNVYENGLNNSSPVLKLTVPGGAFNTSNYVTAKIAVADPSAERGQAAFPGDYLAAQTSTGPADTLLESVAFAEITMVDEATGEEITTLDQPADLSLKLPAIYQTGGSRAGTYDPLEPARNFIELWSFNESRAVWVREDADPSTPDVMDNALVVEDPIDSGILYAQGKVTHFSWWNLDKPVSDQACLCAKVVDDTGTPLTGEIIQAQGFSYSGRSSSDFSDSAGLACVTVKRSISSTQSVDLYVESGAIRFHYPITPVSTPTQQGTTLGSVRNNCVTLAENIVIDFTGSITGRVVDEAANPIANYPVYTTAGGSALTNGSGDYTLAAPVGAAITVYAPNAAGIPVTLLTADPYALADLVVLNQTPIITGIQRDVSGIIANGTSVNLTAMVFDAEGETISYNWSIESGLGTLTPPATSQTATWTAPLSGTGITIIRVIVNDGSGHETSLPVTIHWGSITANLGFTVIDNITETAMEGVTIVLHAPNNTTLEASFATDASGQVSFGNIGRETASFTIIYPQTYFSADALLYTFIDVPVSDTIVLRLADDSITPPNTFTSFGYQITGFPFNPLNPSEYDSYNDFRLISPLDLNPINFIIDGVINQSSRSHFDNNLRDSSNLFTALALGGNSATGDIRFGYVSGIDLEDPGFTGIVNIDLNASAKDITWSTATAGNIELVAKAFKDGVEYKDIFYDYSASPISLRLPEGPRLVDPFDTVSFPADRFHIYARSLFEAGTVRRNYTSPLPDNMTFTFPDNTFDGATYDTGTGTFSWLIGGSSPVDFTELTLSINNPTGGHVNWTVFTNGSNANWSIPDLPAPYDLIAVPVLIGTNDYDTYLNMTVSDYTSMADLSAYWLELQTGRKFIEVLEGLDNTLKANSGPSYHWGPEGF